MAVTWQLTVDCAAPGTLAPFWAAALGYEPAPPPAGFGSWEAWFAHLGVPEDDWGDAATIRDPAGAAPTICFLRVPEGKVAKNRLHLDVQIGGGRQRPWSDRWAVVQAEVARLVSLGARVIAEVAQDGRPDHVVMADPEGNEFCVV